jgi:ribosomal protein L11 methylase PrmA
MNHASSGVFEYKDKSFGDAQGIVVTTNPEVFYPTSTTNLLLAGVRQSVNSATTAASALDLGCGCGIVAVVLAKSILPKAKIHASDISQEAVKLAKHNAADGQLAIDCRCGNLFEPWPGMKFDLIVDDVAGMAEPIARLSQWYPLGNDLLLHLNLIESLMARGLVEIKKRGSRWLWATKIYRAGNQ